MKNEFIPFCLEFSQKYKHVPKGIYYSSDKKYVIEKAEIEAGDYQTPIPARVNKDTGIVQINANLDNYSESAILFLLTWCFFRHENQKQDNNLLSDMVIDEITMETLLKEKQFSPRKAMLSLLENLKDTANIEYVNRLENLIK